MLLMPFWYLRHEIRLGRIEEHWLDSRLGAGQEWGPGPELATTVPIDIAGVRRSAMRGDPSTTTSPVRIAARGSQR